MEHESVPEQTMTANTANDSAYRLTMSNLIFSAAYGLRLPIETAAIAMVYFHMYLDLLGYETLKESTGDTQTMITAIVFLACKTSENIRTIRDVFNIVYCSSAPHEELDAKVMDSHYRKKKSNVIILEQHILRAVGFNIEVDLPYKYMFNIARVLDLSQECVVRTLRYINDTFSSNIVTRVPADIIAIACIVIATKQEQEQHSQQQEQNQEQGVGDNGQPLDGQPLPGRVLQEAWWRNFNVPDQTVFEAVQEIIQRHDSISMALSMMNSM